MRRGKPSPTGWCVESSWLPAQSKMGVSGLLSLPCPCIELASPRPPSSARIRSQPGPSPRRFLPHVRGQARLTVNIFDLIVDLLASGHGWRFYVPLLLLAIAATATHFTIGWTPAGTGTFIFLTLAATLSGILWQYLHDRDR